jgi:hypothetical protein
MDISPPSTGSCSPGCTPRCPELYSILSIDDSHFQQYVVLRYQDYKVSLLIPRVFKYIDQEWAKSQPEGE